MNSLGQTAYFQPVRRLQQASSISFCLGKGWGGESASVSRGELRQGVEEVLPEKAGDHRRASSCYCMSV